MYFHIEVQDIAVGEKLDMQLYDYDYKYLEYKFMSWHRKMHDTSEFPDDPVTKEATVKEVNGKRIASVGVDLRDTWEPVIHDDHSFPGALDWSIELYWDVRYTNKNDYEISEVLPAQEEDYLQVTYNERDLFLLPAAGMPNGLPEIYDSKGNLIVFALKSGRLAVRDVATAPLQTFVATKVRIVNTRTLLPELNAIKKEIHTQKINLNTNATILDSKYSVTEEVNFLVKSKGSFVDVAETSSKSAKKFSDYFNRADGKVIGTKVVKAGIRLLRVLDFIQMTQTVYGILPKEAGEPLNIPSPASTAGIVNLVTLTHGTALSGTVLGRVAGPLALAFAAADIMVKSMVKGLMVDIQEDGKLFLAQALLQGLPAVKRYLSTDSAKICRFEATPVINQRTHEKFMSGEITTYEQLFKSKFDTEEDSDFGEVETMNYIYIYQIVTNPHSEVDNYIVNAIIFL